MNIKKGLIITGLAGSCLLPLSSNAQNNKKSITNGVKTELIDTISREILGKNGKIIKITESYEQIINMPINMLEEKYKENIDAVFSYYVLAEINKRREKLGLKAFTYDKNLTIICQKFSKYMEEKKGRGHNIKEKTSDNMGINTKNYKILRESTVYQSSKASIFEIIENLQYLDDKNDLIRGKQRPANKNHKYTIIADDSDRCGAAITIDGEKKNIYIVINSGTTF